MKMLFSVLLSMSALASTSQAADDFVCSNIADVEEYRVGINLSQKTAWFFDNDDTSEMHLTNVQILESHPPQTMMTFEGKDAGRAGTLKLYFNLTHQTVSLYSVNSSGQPNLVGNTTCRRP